MKRYRFRFDNGTWTKPLTKNGLQTKVRNSIYGPKGEVGEHFEIRVVHVKPPAAPPGSDSWHPLIREVYQFVQANFPQVESWGACNCRKSSHDQSIWSQHSGWKGGCRAIDLHFESKAEGDKVVAAVRKKFGNRIKVVWWTGRHYDHGHFEVVPPKTGKPVCAGGTA